MHSLYFAYVAILAIPSVVSAQSEPEVKPISYPSGYTAKLDLDYVTVGDWQGKMDMYLPPKGSGPSPAIIKIHGGGWNHGSRVSPGGMYFRMGFALINVEYRFARVAPAPAAIEDTRCALKYVKTHAAELNIDPNRIVIQGSSAGAHLALMTGLLGNDPRFDANCSGTADMRVAAIVDEFGPSDFTSPSWSMIGRDKSVLAWLGSHSVDEAFKASVSPVSYVRRGSPPTILVHGTDDRTVPIEQSEVLEKKLKAADVKTELVTVQGAGHGNFTHDQDAMENDKVKEFLHAQGIVR